MRLVALLTCLGTSCSLAGTGLALPADRPVGKLETVALFHGPMPTGVTVSHQGRIFVNFPRWGDPKYDYVTLLAAQRTLAAAKTAYAQALGDLAKAVAEVEGLLQADFKGQ